MKDFLAGSVGNNVLGIALAAVIFIILNAIGLRDIIGSAIGGNMGRYIGAGVVGAIAGGVGFGVAGAIKAAILPKCEEADEANENGEAEKSE